MLAIHSGIPASSKPFTGMGWPRPAKRPKEPNEPKDNFLPTGGVAVVLW